MAQSASLVFCAADWLQKHLPPVPTVHRPSTVRGQGNNFLALRRAAATFAADFD
jgi:hypothetical protein